MLKKSTADQIQLISKNRQQKKSSQMKNYETAEKKRILQQKSEQKEITNENKTQETARYITGQRNTGRHSINAFNDR